MDQRTRLDRCRERERARLESRHELDLDDPARGQGPAGVGDVEVERGGVVGVVAARAEYETTDVREPGGREVVGLADDPCGVHRVDPTPGVGDIEKAVRRVDGEAAEALAAEPAQGNPPRRTLLAADDRSRRCVEHVPRLGRGVVGGAAGVLHLQAGEFSRLERASAIVEAERPQGGARHGRRAQAAFSEADADESGAVGAGVRDDERAAARPERDPGDAAEPEFVRPHRPDLVRLHGVLRRDRCSTCGRGGADEQDGHDECAHDRQILKRAHQRPHVPPLTHAECFLPSPLSRIEAACVRVNRRWARLPPLSFRSG